MRKILFTITLLVMSSLLFSAWSQNYYSTEGRMNADTLKKHDLPKGYIGLGTGINCFTGMLGLRADLRAANKFIVGFGVGVGGWGSKISAAISFVPKDPKGMSYGLGFSHCSGLKDFETTLETTPDGKKNVKMDLNACNNVNAILGYHFPVAKKSQFVLEFGYSFPMEIDNYKILDNSVLTSNGKAVMSLMEPGGLILGISFLLGL
ncbi:MAG: hypothetical protein NTW49_13115 [Bacteroidia bacterium]|nr:hypothetical protein [Bacteroidia bacterium]